MGHGNFQSRMCQNLRPTFNFYFPSNSTQGFWKPGFRGFLMLISVFTQLKILKVLKEVQAIKSTSRVGKIYESETMRYYSWDGLVCGQRFFVHKRYFCPQTRPLPIHNE